MVSIPSTRDSPSGKASYSGPATRAKVGEPEKANKIFNSARKYYTYMYMLRWPRSTFAFFVRGSRFAVICASRFSFVLRGSRFVLRGSRFAVICASRFSFVLRGSRFAVRRHLCLAFFIRASRFAVRRHLCLAFFVRASRFAVRRHLCLAFHVRASRFALSYSQFILSRSCFAVRGSWFVVVLEQGGGSIYHRLFLRSKCAEQSECPVDSTSCHCRRNVLTRISPATTSKSLS